VLRSASHPTLRELHLEGEPPEPELLEALAGGSLPALTTLGIALGAGQDGLDLLAAAAVRSLDAPALRAIQVTGLRDVTAFLADLTAGPLRAPWTLLYAGGSVADEDELLALLRERAPLLRSIPMLALPLADELSGQGFAEAKALLPGVVDAGDVPDLWPVESTEAW
jgi:hypothetical protein